MFDKLPSLRGFQPRFYAGGPTRFHLPLLYDLVASEKPKLVVALGWSDGEGFFTFCQAASEQGVESQCVAIRRERTGESEEDDVAWRKGRDYGEEFYGDRTRFFASSVAALAELADGTVDLLFLDDCDSGMETRGDLSAWEAKLSPEGIVLLHGVALEREDSPKAGWDEWLAARSGALFLEGLGLAVARQSNTESPSSFLLQRLFGRADKVKELAEIYGLAASRIDALGRAARAEEASATLEIRQVWLDSLLADRAKVQEIMDHQARTIAFLEQTQAEVQHHFDNLRRDRAKAQLVMDSQHEQLKHWVAETDRLKSQIEQLKTQIKDHKQILSAAKKACRKSGRCFQIPGGPKERRPFGRENCARASERCRAIWELGEPGSRLNRRNAGRRRAQPFGGPLCAMD